MRYLLKQKLFSLGDDFKIKDESGQDVFFVDGKVLTIRKKLSFQDMAGTELAFIRQRLWSLRPTYDILRDGQRVATVKKHLFTFFRSKFTVDVPGRDPLLARGNLSGHEYEFTRHGQILATVSKKWFSLSDTYGVDILPDEDDVLILASAVVIDLVSHGERNVAVGG